MYFDQCTATIQLKTKKAVKIPKSSLCVMEWNFTYRYRCCTVMEWNLTYHRCYAQIIFESWVIWLKETSGFSFSLPVVNFMIYITKIMGRFITVG